MLYRKGAGGPIFDWLRMLYGSMSYVVRLGSQVSTPFATTIGILTGDTSSPTLWNFVSSDLYISPHPEDTVMAGVVINHLLHADDGAMWSGPNGIVAHLDEYGSYASRKGFMVNVPKTKAMVFGVVPEVLPTLYLQGKPIEWVDEHKYLGSTFSSRKGGLFATMYAAKAVTARKTANVTLRLQKHFGDLPPAQALMIYKSRIASHASEVAIDLRAANLALLEAVEVYFLRRVLHLHDRSRIAILYSETGIVPLRFTRISRPLRFLRGLWQLPDARLVTRCLSAYVALWRAGKPGWLSDVVHVLLRVGVVPPLDWGEALSSVAGIDSLVAGVRVAAERWVSDQIGQQRLPMLVGRRQGGKGGKVSSHALVFRSYLLTRIPAHRVALTRLMTGSHTLGVEAAKWLPRPVAFAQGVPRHWRLCRLCGDDTEDELHVLMWCTAPSLVERRTLMMLAVWKLYPALKGRAKTPIEWWHMVMEYDELIPLVAAYVYDLLQIVLDEPMYVPDWYQ
ncbi:hypothetical protein BDZ89DRAFT_947954 [Hymenopellis radicata]|nr:hypothetical protein BDZ89DRAFT_947954 [Hymenopellis radicata]